MDKLAVRTGIEERKIWTVPQLFAKASGYVLVRRYDDVEPSDAARCELTHRGGDRGDASAPTLSAMAGNQQPRQGSLVNRPGWKLCDHRMKRIDAGIASDVNSSRHSFAREIEGREIGRGKQQIGLGIDLDAIFLLRPREGAIARSEARFHMSERDLGSSRGSRAAKRARRISLHDQQIGSIVEYRLERAGDLRGMRMRILLAGASEMDRVIVAKTMIPEVEPRMLARDNQRRAERTRCQRMSDRGEFDSFWPGADDQPDVGRMQPSPYLGWRRLPPLRIFLNGNCRRRPAASIGPAALG